MSISIKNVIKRPKIPDDSESSEMLIPYHTSIKIELITQHAQTMVRQGRSSSVQKWINGLPSAIRANAPWVLYWEGICLMAVDLVACRSS